MPYLLDGTWLVEYLRGNLEFVQAMRDRQPDGLAIIGVDDTVARVWGQEDTRLSLAGQKIGDIDLFIAATALAYDLTVCSQNRGHFARVDGLKLESL